MAETTKTTKKQTEKKVEKKVDLFVPYVEGEEEFIDVGVNGKIYRIQRGVTVQVPESVRHVIELSNHQNLIAIRNRESFKDQNLSE